MAIAARTYFILLHVKPDLKSISEIAKVLVSKFRVLSDNEYPSFIPELQRYSARYDSVAC